MLHLARGIPAAVRCSDKEYEAIYGPLLAAAGNGLST